MLTTLGIIIGVMTVITMMSIVQGINRYVYRILGTIGSNVIYVQKYEWQVGVGSGGGRSRKEWLEIAKRKDFTDGDVKAISELPSIDRATLAQTIWGRGGRKITYLGEEMEVQQIEGATPEYII